MDNIAILGNNETVKQRKLMTMVWKVGLNINNKIEYMMISRQGKKY